MDLSIWLLGIKIFITVLAVFCLCWVGGMLLSSKLINWMFPEPQITVLGDILPFHSIYKNIILGKDGACSQILKINGYDAGSKTSAEIESLIVKKQHWLDKMAENGATFKLLTIRREQQHHLEPGDVPEVLKEIHHAWMQNFKKTYHNTHYLVLTVYSKKNNVFKKDEPVANTGLLKELTTLCEDMLVDFKGELVKNGESATENDWSELISLLHELASAEQENLRSQIENVAYQIGTHVRFVKNSDIIQYSNGFGKIVSLNKWTNTVSSEMLKEIQSLPSKLIILQMFNPKGKVSSIAALNYQRKQKQMPFPNSHVDEDYQIAVDEIQANRTRLYDYQLSVLVLGKNMVELDEAVSQVKRLFISYGKTPIVEYDAKEWIYRCMFPGVDKMVRPAHPLSCNLSYLINFECEPKGLDKCDWGDDGPIRSFKTASGSAYALQLHVNDEKEALAHSVVVAPAGSGKTTLFEHLIGGALKHNKLRAFIFDRFNGTKIFTQAVGGNYVDFSDRNVPLNPFFCHGDESDKVFLQAFLLMLAKCNDDQSIEEASLAVEQILTLPKENRILTQCFQDIARKDSVFAKGLRKWASDFSLSRWFNGYILVEDHQMAFDSLDLNASRLTAFEMTKIQERPEVAAAVTTYLMHRIRSLSIEAYPHMIFIDETQPMMEDLVFAKQVSVLLKEHRKLRGSVSVCFQDVNAVSSVILEQCQTRFLFPNLSASKEAYAKFELTNFEWDYIKGFNRISRELKRSVLVKKPGESVILNVDMSSLGKYLQLYRSGSEPVKIVRELQQQWGMDDWVPKYLSL